jgi:hypothetical protein
LITNPNVTVLILDCFCHKQTRRPGQWFMVNRSPTGFLKPG